MKNESWAAGQRCVNINARYEPEALWHEARCSIVNVVVNVNDNGGEGTIEGMGSSIRGGGGESFLSEQEGRGRRLFQLLHRRRGPSRRSRSRLRRPQGAVRFSALHGRSGGVRVKGYQGGGGEGSSGDRPREVIKRGCAGRRGQCHVCSPWVVLCMTRGCTDGTGPWPTLEP